MRLASTWLVALCSIGVILSSATILFAEDTVYEPGTFFDTAIGLKSSLPQPGEEFEQQASGENPIIQPPTPDAPQQLSVESLTGPMISLDPPAKKSSPNSKWLGIEDEVRFLFPADVNDPSGIQGGQLQIFELDLNRSEQEQGTVLLPLDQTRNPFFSYREWSGPDNPSLPPNVFRFSFPIAFDTRVEGNGGLGFSVTPQFASDMRANMNSDAWMFDIDLVSHRKITDEVHLVLGAFYWDRVEAIVLPHAGITWSPSNDVYFHLVYPHPEMGICLHRGKDSQFWLTSGLEYHVEAYQINSGITGGNEMVQLADYRALWGFKINGENVSLKMGIGYVFDRELLFRHSDQIYSLDSGLLLTGGLTY